MNHYDEKNDDTLRVPAPGPGLPDSQCMDSQTLVNNPSRYRVISTSPDGIVYADMDSLRAMQTMDYPNSIENMSLTLYVEKYAGIRDDLVFQMGQEIHQINEYKAALHANKREGTYDLKADLTKVYRPDGTDYAVKIDTVQFKNVRDMYTALHTSPPSRRRRISGSWLVVRG